MSGTPISITVSSKKRELTSPDVDTDTKKNRVSGSQSEAETDISDLSLNMDTARSPEEADEVSTQVTLSDTNLQTMATMIQQSFQPQPSEPPWITSFLKSQIRKRKRAYRKAKRTNSLLHWASFKRLRNKVVSMIRDSKKLYYDKIADKLKAETLTAKDWWSTLKTVISPNSKSSIPALESNDIIYTNDRDKANVLNNFFQSQTILDE